MGSISQDQINVDLFDEVNRLQKELAACKVDRNQILDEVMNVVNKAYLDLGDTYTSLEMHNDTMEAIEGMKQ